jgi:hypothetical protein
MNRQRNNVAVLPFEQRKLVCRMLLDGKAYAAIDAAVKAECPQAKTLHSTTLKAYRKSQEYKTYADGRMKIEPKLAADRWTADALRECAGIETVTDMAEMALANQLRELVDRNSGEASELMQLVKAVTAIKRTNLANKDEEYKQTLRKLKEQHAAELAAERAELQAEIAELSATIANLTDSRSGVDATVVQNNLDQVLGVKK